MGAHGLRHPLRDRAQLRPIFFNNCFQNGVLPIQLPRADVLAIADELEAATRPGSNSEPRLSIDLHNRTVVTPSGRKIEFHVDGIRRDALLKGLNEVALTLTREDEIAAHRPRRAPRRRGCIQRANASYAIATNTPHPLMSVDSMGRASFFVAPQGCGA